jgi:hypothetical protein
MNITKEWKGNNMGYKPTEVEIERELDSLVPRYSQAELKSFGGRPALRNAAIQRLQIHHMYIPVRGFMGKPDIGGITDGYHSFDDLYEFRMAYNALLFNEWANLGLYDVHKSWRHADGELCFGKDNYFVVVATTPAGQITNHYHGEHWDLFKLPERERAVEWDGHTALEALQRMLQLAREGWMSFTADYDKTFYDVWLPTGEIVKECWPNAGSMNSSDDSDRSWVVGEPIAVRKTLKTTKE